MMSIGIVEEGPDIHVIEALIVSSNSSNKVGLGQIYFSVYCNSILVPTIEIR